MSDPNVLRGFRVAVHWPDSEDDECPACGAHLKPAIAIGGPPNTLAVVCPFCNFYALRLNCHHCNKPFARDDQSQWAPPDRFYHAACAAITVREHQHE